MRKCLPELSAYSTIGLAVGDSPSGKAPGSGPGIRGFESLIPSHEIRLTICQSYFFLQIFLLFMTILVGIFFQVINTPTAPKSNSDQTPLGTINVAPNNIDVSPPLNITRPSTTANSKITTGFPSSSWRSRPTDLAFDRHDFGISVLLFLCFNSPT